MIRKKGRINKRTIPETVISYTLFPGKERGGRKKALPPGAIKSGHFSTRQKRKGLSTLPSFVCGFAFSSILALAGGFGLLLALHTGLLVVLTTTDLGEDATAGALALPSLESAFQGFVFSDSDFHFSPSPPEPT